MEASYKWVDHHTKSGSLPATAVLAGTGPDGNDIYVGRARHGDHMIPAEIVPEKNVAYVCWDRKQYVKTEFQVLCQKPLSWVHSSNGSVPENAVKAGKTADGELLYLGRRRCDNDQYPQVTYRVGKIQPSCKRIHIPDESEAVPFEDYEVLVFD